MEKKWEKKRKKGERVLKGENIIDQIEKKGSENVPIFLRIFFNLKGDKSSSKPLRRWRVIAAFRAGSEKLGVGNQVENNWHGE